MSLKKQAFLYLSYFTNCQTSLSFKFLIDLESIINKFFFLIADITVNTITRRRCNCSQRQDPCSHLMLSQGRNEPISDENDRGSSYGAPRKRGFFLLDILRRISGRKDLRQDTQGEGNARRTLGDGVSLRHESEVLSNEGESLDHSCVVLENDIDLCIFYFLFTFFT